MSAARGDAADLPDVTDVADMTDVADAADAGVGHLDGIGLDELVATAALLTRVDRKYLVPATAVPDVLAGLPAATRALDDGSRRWFGYRSVYLDTPELDSFHAAGRGRRRRWKTRTRSYLDSGESYLEVKTTGPRGATVKERIPADADPTARAAFLAARLGDAAERIRPTLETGYRRATLLLPSGSRATIDTELVVRSRLADRTGAPRGLVIVETKSGAAPGELDRLLWRAGYRPARVSKYGAGLAALHPELPAMKWHRVLERQLRTPDRATPTRPAPLAA